MGLEERGQTTDDRRQKTIWNFELRIADLVKRRRTFKMAPRVSGSSASRIAPRCSFNTFVNLFSKYFQTNADGFVSVSLAF